MGTARKFVVIGAGLIALYLVVANFKGFAADEAAAATGGSSLVKAFQGR
jgi:hypothetical protein